MDEWISRQHTLLVVAQEKDPDITDYPINSYVLYTPPTGRSNKLLSKHKRPYQVPGRNQSVYIIEDLVRGKQIRTHVHNLRPFLFNHDQFDPQDVAQRNEQEGVVGEILAKIDYGDTGPMDWL